MYAIRISDLTDNVFNIRSNFSVTGILVSPVKGDIVDVEHDAIDGQAITLSCDDDRAQALIQVLRIKLPTLRAYKQGAKGGWTSYKAAK